MHHADVWITTAFSGAKVKLVRIQHDCFISYSVNVLPSSTPHQMNEYIAWFLAANNGSIQDVCPCHGVSFTLNLNGVMHVEKAIACRRIKLGLPAYHE